MFSATLRASIPSRKSRYETYACLVASNDEIEWVALRTLNSREEAQLLGDLLAKHGIVASVEGAYAAGVLPGVASVRVMVPRDRLEDAQKAASAFGE